MRKIDARTNAAISEGYYHSPYDPQRVVKVTAIHRAYGNRTAVEAPHDLTLTEALNITSHLKGDKP